jgi:hypothetical protein
MKNRFRTEPERSGGRPKPSRLPAYVVYGTLTVLAAFSINAATALGLET